MNWQFHLVAVGKMKDRLLEAKTAEFLARLRPWAKLEVTELPDSAPEHEQEAIRRVLEREKGAHRILLSEEGRAFTSAAFGDYLSRLDRRVVFVIGGPLGLAPELRREGDLLLSLSPMTFTHELARLLLAEQLYRACSIVHGGKYHHA